MPLPWRCSRSRVCDMAGETRSTNPPRNGTTKRCATAGSSVCTPGSGGAWATWRGAGRQHNARAGEPPLSGLKQPGWLGGGSGGAHGARMKSTPCRCAPPEACRPQRAAVEAGWHATTDEDAQTGDGRQLDVCSREHA